MTTTRPSSSSMGGCVLKINPQTPNQGVLSGPAFPKSGVQVRLLMKRQSSHTTAPSAADVLVTNGTRTWMIKSSCIVCGEAEEGKRRLEIMQQIYDLVLRGDFAAARKVFAQMHRLLL